MNSNNDKPCEEHRNSVMKFHCSPGKDFYRVLLRRFAILHLLIFLVLLCSIPFQCSTLISYGISYAKFLVEFVGKDASRRAYSTDMVAQTEWDHYVLQVKYMKEICREKNISKRTDLSWITALVNDQYVIPAVVLGYSIQALSCVKNMLVLISKDVSQAGVTALKKSGWNVKVVTAMDCKWLETKQGRVSSGNGILGTHTRFHAWNYTQYRKMIYVDPDYMLLSNIDELFDISEDLAAAYGSRPGIIDPCFNAGLLVFKPSAKDYKQIMDTWERRTASESCPNDQVLLWHHYTANGRWKPLPYSYNVRRVIYHPMKAFHFTCCPPEKPWIDVCRPSRREAMFFQGPITKIEHTSVMFWKNFYAALHKFELESWWRDNKAFKHDLEFGGTLYSECLNKV